MPWFRETLLGHDSKAPAPHNWRRWVKILVIVLLIGAAWYLGILASVFYILKLLSAAIWTMARDVAAACGDFIQYVLSQARH
jgi:hypothetical protein